MNNESKIYYYFYLLLLVTPILSIFLGFDFNKILFGIIIVVIVYLFFVKKNKRNLYIALIVLILIILESILISIINNINLQSAINELLYYLKSILFLFFGYYFLKKRDFKYVIYIAIIYVTLGTLFDFIFSEQIVSLASKKTANDTDITLHFWVYNTYLSSFINYIWFTKDGAILRNPGFFLSPIENGFFIAFICFWLISNKMNKYLIIFTIYLLFTTILRSAWIFLFISILSYIFINMNIKRKIIFIMLILIIIASIIIIFLPVFQYFFLLEDSASIHFLNLQDSISRVFKYPFGTGFGSSGWSLDPNSPLSIYSEGSILTLLIELGFQGLLLIIFYFKLIKKSINKRFNYSIFFGYMIASFTLPIFFQTYINFLLFTFLGSEIRENEKT